MWSVIKSVLAALIGVQNDRQRQHDFSNGKPAAFIFTAIVVTLLFVLVLASIAMFAAG
ncbi:MULTISPECIES: DUF2970 domain-containing protein [Halomonadaceae]|jgi:hypothetical protein|uniref:DUF2970 domain-containing protein n=1 Tax=Vreelandella piezotolerans TaxID=2609667 RepID=A0ABQ6X4S2_9GAMM|nr:MULTISPECIES: DUF2970 domain-containing protein [Halomonas]KAE8437029.1 DUF2970 domain-containing protein [Halomonas piezotolerans]MCG7577656.1 DUF2970 domain-containing protein [Halomonas sp. MMH1-48]MCG7604722.1 DUF2970 domain-containing protein [Halomonas sp. MM17-34]MCG7613855.1 DUF2970 domain-containing protein [Halomonas sp. MM17-29]MCG7620773.1 DUF2970 domain-containing protein [Halomonas sp. DSH1-27]